jgi:hypothetical protein
VFKRSIACAPLDVSVSVSFNMRASGHGSDLSFSSQEPVVGDFERRSKDLETNRVSPASMCTFHVPLSV